MQEGQTLQIQADRPVTWKFVGNSGTLSATSSTTANYTAPSSIIPLHARGGCQVFPNDSIYNTRIDNLPLDPNSANWTSPTYVGAAGLNFDPSWGLNVIDNTTPAVQESFYYTVANNGPFQMPQWPNLTREGGVFVSNWAGNGDHHIMSVNHENCQFYETYNDYFTPHTCRDGTPGCTATSGYTFNGNGYQLATNGATDAAGLSLAALVWHLDEIKAGVIHHPVRFTQPAGYINPGRIWPAAGGGGWCAGTQCPSYGARYRLRASYDISSFSPTAQVLLTALKQYGMILADAGSSASIVPDEDATADNLVTSAFGEIQSKGITLANFEVVDSSSLMESQWSAKVNPNNPYVQPANSAAVVVTDAANPANSLTIPIALQGVAIGLKSPTLNILAGTPGYQVQSWVNGTSNQTINWTLVSGVGSVTAGGVYTAPASAASPTDTVLKATSAADPNAIAYLYVKVLPNSTTTPGSIRIGIGSHGVTDGSGNYWLPDMFSDGGLQIWYSQAGPWVSSALNNPLLPVYSQEVYTYGSDLVYRFAVPNGNYQVHFLSDRTGGYCTGGPYTDADGGGPKNYEANGQIGLHGFDLAVATHFTCGVPTEQIIPARVTDQTLKVAVRGYGPNPMSFGPGANLAGLEIVPDTVTAPHLTIDSTGQATTVLADQSLQLFAVGWYMSNSVTWKVMSGTGTVDATGLFTPSAPTGQSQQTVVQATSTIDPSQVATITLTTVFGSMAITPNASTVTPNNSLQLGAMLNGASYTNVSWSISPQLGSIGQDGLYTAPTAIQSQTSMVTVTAVSKDNPAASATATITIPAGLAIRVNSGGSGFTDAKGNIWSADYGFGPNTVSYSDGKSVANTTSDMLPLYTSSRYVYNTDSFYYQFSVPNGHYAVTLMWADYESKNQGQTFNVGLNGTQVLTNFSIDLMAGGAAKAYNQTFNVSVSNGSIHIDFTASNSMGASINGIQIIYTGP